jgi:hypothetical protein
LDIINVHFSFLENGLGKNYRRFYIYYRFSYLKKQLLKKVGQKALRLLRFLIWMADAWMADAWMADAWMADAWMADAWMADAWMADDIIVATETLRKIWLHLLKRWIKKLNLFLCEL